MKDMNMNAVRISHYPSDAFFLDLCDELRLYVLDDLTDWQQHYDEGFGVAYLPHMPVPVSLVVVGVSAGNVARVAAARVPVRGYFVEFVAYRNRPSSSRSYAYDLLRWWRWLQVLDVPWERATSAEGRFRAIVATVTVFMMPVRC
jgi:hypothetical protein